MQLTFEGKGKHLTTSDIALQKHLSSVHSGHSFHLSLRFL